MVMCINNKGQKHVCTLNNIYDDSYFEKYRGTLGLILTDCVKDKFKANT